jgi:hypothetical protein
LFARRIASIVVSMRTASAFEIPADIPPTRPRLVVVADPEPARPVPGRQRLAALLAGLSSGFVLAALATALGGGDPAASLMVAAAAGVLLAAVLVRARVLAVRARRRRAARARAALRAAARVPASGAAAAACEPGRVLRAA